MGARCFDRDEAGGVACGMLRESALVSAVEKAVSLPNMARRVLATAARTVA